MATPEQIKAEPGLRAERDKAGNPYYLLRGSSWQDYWQQQLRTDGFLLRDPTFHPDNGGFRIVLEINTKPPAKPAR
jgi:hypothetical protein